MEAWKHNITGYWVLCSVAPVPPLTAALVHQVLYQKQTNSQTRKNRNKKPTKSRPRSGYHKQSLGCTPTLGPSWTNTNSPLTSWVYSVYWGSSINSSQRRVHTLVSHTCLACSHGPTMANLFLPSPCCVRQPADCKLGLSRVGSQPRAWCFPSLSSFFFQYCTSFLPFSAILVN